jgi:UPF0271 protein
VSHKPAATVIDLNADLGEGTGADAELLTLITSANIACGGHAGDATTIQRIVKVAVSRGVGIGAHPSYPDREGFGRRVMQLLPAEVTATVAAQMRVVADAARRAGTRLQHVKPHGALYNQAAADRVLAMAIGQAVQQVDSSLIVVALAGSPMVTVLREMGLRVAQEAFVDRGYTVSGTLVPRGQPGDLVTDRTLVAQRAVELAADHRVTAADGRTVHVTADTLCIHGDTPQAPVLAREVRQALDAAGIGVRRLDTFF